MFWLCVCVTVCLVSIVRPYLYLMFGGLDRAMSWLFSERFIIFALTVMLISFASLQSLQWCKWIVVARVVGLLKWVVFCSQRWPVWQINLVQRLDGMIMKKKLIFILCSNWLLYDFWDLSFPSETHDKLGFWVHLNDWNNFAIFFIIF